MKLMGMRNIEVLATLFLLSYAKLLKTIVTSLSFTNIMVASADNVSDVLTPQQVWIYDGNITYLSRKHLPLFVIALLFLLVLFLPYTILLIFGQCLRSLPRRKGLLWIQSTIVSSIMDAYHAPYTRHHRYWTGLGLMIRCCLFAIFSTNDNININLFWIILVVVFMLAIRQSFWDIVYQKKLADLLELLHLVNLVVLSAALLYGHLCYTLTISAALSLVLFTGTLLYHLNLETKGKLLLYTKVFNKLHLLIIGKKCDPTIASEDKVEASETKGHTTTYVELRETLIDN